MTAVSVLLLTSLLGSTAEIIKVFNTNDDVLIATIFDSSEVPSDERFGLKLRFLRGFAATADTDYVEITFNPVTGSYPCTSLKVLNNYLKLEIVGVVSLPLPSPISQEVEGVHFRMEWSDEYVRVSVGDSVLESARDDEFICVVDSISASQTGSGEVEWIIDDLSDVCQPSNQEALGIKTTVLNRWKVEGQTTQAIYAGSKADITCGSDSGLRLYVNQNAVVANDNCGPTLQECTPHTSSGVGGGTLCQFTCSCIDEGSCQNLYLTEARALP